MLIPRRLPVKVKCILYPIVLSLHGFAFGILYAPAQAIIYGYNLEQAVAWVAAGFPFDIIHGISNFAAGTLVYSLSELLVKLYKGKVK
jgi:energy-coupling factor transport system substrate-specific component